MGGSAQTKEKLAAAKAALDLVEVGMTLGLGTGSTVEKFLDVLGEKARSLKLTCAASSRITQAQGEALGLRFAPLAKLAPLDLAVDGADELTKALELTKGGGGALLREKEVAKAARRFVVITDSSKLVKTLGKFPLPIEVARREHAQTAARLSEALAVPQQNICLRMSNQAPFVTDSGHYIYDVALTQISHPARLSQRLDSIAGVLAHGLFCDLATAALIAKGEHILTLGDVKAERDYVTI